MVAFDLHRFDLLVQLHYRLPVSLEDERDLNERVTKFLANLEPSTLQKERAHRRRGRPIPPLVPRLEYEHPPTGQAEPEPGRWDWDALLGPEDKR